MVWHKANNKTEELVPGLYKVHLLQTSCAYCTKYKVKSVHTFMVLIFQTKLSQEKMLMQTFIWIWKIVFVQNNWQIWYVELKLFSMQHPKSLIFWFSISYGFQLFQRFNCQIPKTCFLSICPISNCCRCINFHNLDSETSMKRLLMVKAEIEI